jgi:hypothetical protein
MRIAVRTLLLSLAVALPAQAHAAVTPLWFAGQLHAGAVPTRADVAPFTAASGVAQQNIGGIPFWLYVKGSRTSHATYPESWYVHQNGVRVRDAFYHTFVMNPASAGWDAVVLRECAPRCFLDGVGASAVTRTRPLLNWPVSRWAGAVVAELRYLESHGARVIPNSVSDQTAAYLRVTGVASTEHFFGLDHLDVIRLGHVWVVEKHRCGWFLAAFLMARGRGDRFACSEPGTMPWTIPAVMRGAALGHALGRARRTARGYVRSFAHGRVVARLDGSYAIVR